MGLINCPECGKLCVENPSKLCPDCYEQEQRDEQKVVNYLREAPGASIEAIHEATGVKEKVILRMIRAGRVTGTVISYPCETCGTQITEGRLCAKCNKSIFEQLQHGHRPQRPEQPQQDAARRRARMYTEGMSDD